MFQLAADMVKMFFKEDWIPPFVDKLTSLLAPVIAMSALLIAFAHRADHADLGRGAT